MTSPAPPNPLEVFGPPVMRCLLLLLLAFLWGAFMLETSVHKRGPLSSKFTPEMTPSVTIYMYMVFLKADTNEYIHRANRLQPCTGHLWGDVLPPALMESCFKMIFRLFPPKCRLWFPSIEELLKKKCLHVLFQVCHVVLFVSS